MTLDLPDALMLRSVHQANPNTIVQVGTQMTRLPKYPAARQAIKDGDAATADDRANNVWSPRR